MQITGTSTISGVTRTLDISVTTEQLLLWQSGKHIQNVIPHLTSDEREFIISRINNVVVEWEKLCEEDFWDDDETSKL